MSLTPPSSHGGGSSIGIWANGQSALTKMFASPAGFSVHPIQTISGGNLVGGGAPTGRLSGFSALPVTPYSSGPLIDLSSNCAAVLAGIVAAVPPPFILDIDVVVLVCDGTGTNAAHAAVAAELDAPITDLAFTANLPGATWTIDAGLDLSAVGPALSSTAGGAYSIWLGIQAAWDS